jgi:ABC-type transport system involved in multi-copper enzyme maturation permease subunit
MTGELSWISNLKRTYIGNATATRDMRIQLRGSRAAVLFTTYLVVMSFVLLMVYANSLGDGGRYSLATAQNNLQTFYYSTLGSLAVVITLVAPSMGAFAIVSEKQRRSLDLVFSAPTEPKYYLVGKLISSYRYVWLLLVLSLPFCAVSVTLGGTTWMQLFITFLLYSFYGLVCVSFGLLMSTLCSKVLPAIIWTYAALACYLLLTGGFFGASVASTRGTFAGLNPLVSLFPASYSFVADQSWPIFGREIPTWILTILIHLVVVKFVILAAGSMLAPGNSKEIRSLRIHGLIYCAFVTFLIALGITPLLQSIISSGLTSQAQVQAAHGRVVFAILLTIGMMIVPYLASYCNSDLRRHRPDGIMRISQTLSGRPSGNIVYLCLLFATVVVSYVVGAKYYGTTSTFIPFGLSSASASISLPGSFDLNPFAQWFLMYVALGFSIWSVAFFLGWFGVSNKPILSRGRTLSLFFFVLVLILPTALFAILAPEDSRTGTGIWLVNPIAGVICDLPYAGITGFHATALLLLTLLLIAYTLPKVRKQSQQSFEPRSEVRHDSNEKISAV